MYIYTFFNISTFVFISLYTYIYIYIHLERAKKKETEKEREREAKAERNLPSALSPGVQVLEQEHLTPLLLSVHPLILRHLAGGAWGLRPGLGLV